MNRPRQLVSVLGAAALGAAVLSAAPAHAAGDTSISGTVTAKSGAAIPGICVDASGNDGWAEATTDAQGAYSITGLAPGSYRVNFYECADPKHDYIAQYYDNTLDYSAAKLVDSSTNPTGIDAVMSVGTTISGTVTAADGGAPLENVCANASSYATDDEAGYAETDAQGHYTIHGLAPDRYYVNFSDCAQSKRNFLDQYYDHTSDFSKAAAVDSSSNPTGIDAALTSGGTIAGTVTDSTGAPLAGECVQTAMLPGTTYTSNYGQTRTAQDGTFTLNGLAAGPVEVFVSDCGAGDGSGATHATTWFRNASDAGNAAPAQADASAVFVTLGQESALGTISMPDAGGIGGSVVDGQTGKPIAHVCVIAHSPDEYVDELGEVDDGYQDNRSTTDANGVFQIGGLAPGVWKVELQDCGSGIQSTWVYGKAGLHTADAVHVVAGQSTSIYGIGTGDGGGSGSPTVQGGTITGRVSAPDGTPVSHACAHAQPVDNTASPYDAYSSSMTDANGTYSLTGLPEGNYNLSFDNCPNYRFPNGVHPNFLPVYDSNPVSVLKGQSTTVDGQFTTVGGTIQGTLVQKGTTTPVAGVDVSAWPAASCNGSCASGGDVRTDAAGKFEIVGLDAGSYDLDYDSIGSDPYVVSGTGGTYDVTSNAGALSSTDAGNVPVDVGGRFTVHVVDSSGEGIPGLDWELQRSDGTIVTETNYLIPRDYHGYYRPETVPPGDYTLVFKQCNYVGSDPCTPVGTYTKDGSSTVTISPETTTDLGDFTLPATRTTTTVDANPQTASPDDQVTLNAVVVSKTGAGTPTGRVSFFSEHGQSLGDAALDNGTASLTVTGSNLGTGVHEIKAHYSGDGTYANSNGYTAVSISGAAGKSASSTAVTSSMNPSNQGDQVTFTVKVIGPDGSAVPTGTVQLLVNGSNYGGPATLQNGSAAVTVTTLPAGASTVSALYSGDTLYASSVGSVTQTVNASTANTGTSTALATSNASVTEGDAVTFTAAVTPDSGNASPSGNVTFADNGTPLATRSLNSGTATYQTSTLSVGTHSITATYVGDATYTSSTSAVVTETVAAKPPVNGGGGGGGTGGGGTTGGGGSTGGGSTPPPTTSTPIPVTAGGSASSDPGATAPSATNPVIATVTSPNAGTVSFDKLTAEPSPGNYSSLYAVAISAPAATPEKPLALTFQLDSSILPANVPPEQVVMFRNGTAIQPCTSTDGTAQPDPCVVAQSFDGSTLTIMVLSSHASHWVAGLAPVVRIAGHDRYATAVAASQSSFPAAHSADAAVLANDKKFADALVAGPLAAQKRAPLLLTAGDALSKPTASELERVLGKGGIVYVVGGRLSVSDKVVQALHADGFRTVRYAGHDRYATATDVATRGLGSPGTVFEANGNDFPDALSAAPAAAARHGAILLTDGPHQAPATATYLAKIRKATRFAIGGDAAKADPTATTVVGHDRYATSAMVAKRFFDKPSELAFASATKFADALTGGAVAARAGIPMVLVSPSGELSSYIGAYLGSVRGDVTTTLLYGGPLSVSTGVEGQLAKVLTR